MLSALAVILSLGGAGRASAELVYGHALSFNGVNQYISITNFGHIVSTAVVTVEFWANASAIGQQSAFMLAPDDATNRFQANISNADGKTYWDFGDINSAGRLSATGPTNSIGRWIHYTLIAGQSSGYMLIYTNGVLFASRSGMTPFTPGNYELRIGGSTSNFFAGSLDEFRVWKTTRSEAQIQADMAAPLVGNEPGLLLYYRFNNAGTVVSNSATLTRGTYNGWLVNSPDWISSDVPARVMVTNVNDFGPSSLRQVIADATNGYTITFSNNLSGKTITLTNGELLLEKSLTIDASALTNGIAINGNHASRIFQVAGGKTLTLSALTLTNGFSSADGGAINNLGSAMILNQCKLAGNVTTNGGIGGGIQNSGTMTLNQCVLSGNQASGSGGGVANNALLTLNQCTVSGNQASAIGGGAANGGGVVNYGELTLNQSTLSGNQTAGHGGAIYDLGVTKVNQCTLASNTAALNGGAIYCDPTNRLIISQSTISGNVANLGGGIANLGGLSFSVTNTIVAGNSAVSSANISGAFDGTNNVIDVDPMLTALGNHGGSTQTMPPLSGSPAVDTGGSTSLTTDQRGLSRKIGPSTDIGAVEFQDANPVVLNNADSGIGSLRYALTYCPIGANITFTNTLSGATILLTSGKLMVGNDLTLDGSALTDGIIIDGNQTNTVFYVAAGKVVLTGLTITNGLGINDGIGGGGIYSKANLTVNQCTIIGNTATNTIGHNAYGGGICNNGGTLTLNRSTVSGNQAVGSTNGFGGGLVNYAGKSILNQDTFTGNTAVGGVSAIANFGAMTINQSTITRNSAPDFGCIYNSRTLTLTNTIVAGNPDSVNGDIYNDGALNRGGANIVQVLKNDLGADAGAAAINLAPLLAPLGNYGGPTQTMPPLSGGSPAVDGCTKGTSFTIDQRGLPRVVGARADIGAVEVQAMSVTNSPTLTVSSPVAGQFWSNGLFTASGTAHDNVAVANVLYSLNNSDWIAATSTNNWTSWTAQLNLTPGTNTFAVFAVDAQGNLSLSSTQKIVYVVSSTLTIAINGPGTISPANYTNATLLVGKGYTVTGTASKSGFAFKNWTDSQTNIISSVATLPFVMTSNLSLTANFVDSQKPVLSITNVPLASNFSNELFALKGNASDNVAVSNVWVRMNNGTWESATNGNSLTNWAANLTLSPGTNTLAAYAVDTAGNHSLTNTVKLFDVDNSVLTVTINGPGAINPASYTNINLPVGRNFVVTGTPTKAGYALTNWARGNTVVTNKPVLTFLMASNLSFTANFVDIAKPVLTVTTPTAATSASSEMFFAGGKALDNAGVTNVLYNLNSMGWVSPDHTTGWTNWSATLGLIPGTNYLLAYAVDTSSNLSTTNSIKFIYTTAPATLSGLAAKVTPDGGNTFRDTFGATSFSQVSSDTNNVNGVGNYTYTKQSPNRGQLKLTYTAPPIATNEGMQIINLTFTAPNVARFTNGLDIGSIVFTSAPVLVPAAILNQTVVVMDDVNGPGSQGQTLAFTAGTYVSSNLVTQSVHTNIGYTYATYGPAGALLKHISTNGQSYTVFTYWGTNYGTSHVENYNVAGVFTDASTHDFAIASLRAGGNAPTNLVGRSVAFYNHGAYSRAAFSDATNFTIGDTLNLISDYTGSLTAGTYVYSRTASNTASLSLNYLSGSPLYSYQFIAPNFGYITFPGGVYILGVLIK